MRSAGDPRRGLLVIDPRATASPRGTGPLRQSRADGLQGPGASGDPVDRLGLPESALGEILREQGAESPGGAGAAGARLVENPGGDLERLLEDTSLLGRRQGSARSRISPGPASSERRATGGSAGPLSEDSGSAGPRTLSARASSIPSRVVRAARATSSSAAERSVTCAAMRARRASIRFGGAPELTRRLDRGCRRVRAARLRTAGREPRERLELLLAVDHGPLAGRHVEQKVPREGFGTSASSAWRCRMVWLARARLPRPARSGPGQVGAGPATPSLAARPRPRVPSPPRETRDPAREPRQGRCEHARPRPSPSARAAVRDLRGCSLRDAARGSAEIQAAGPAVIPNPNGCLDPPSPARAVAKADDRISPARAVTRGPGRSSASAVDQRPASSRPVRSAPRTAASRGARAN